VKKNERFEWYILLNVVFMVFRERVFEFVFIVILVLFYDFNRLMSVLYDILVGIAEYVNIDCIVLYNLIDPL
jgi:hypothetical protein